MLNSITYLRVFKRIFFFNAAAMHFIPDSSIVLYQILKEDYKYQHQTIHLQNKWLQTYSNAVNVLFFSNAWKRDFIPSSAIWLSPTLSPQSQLIHKT